MHVRGLSYLSIQKIRSIVGMVEGRFRTRILLCVLGWFSVETEGLWAAEISAFEASRACRSSAWNSASSSSSSLSMAIGAGGGGFVVSRKLSAIDF